MNLLGPDILAEIVIHIGQDFSRHVYVSKLDTTAAIMAKIVESVVRAGVDLGAQHGITVQFTPATPPSGGSPP